MKIIDISANQGNIDWEKTSKQIDFAIVRASVGMNKDTKYTRNIDGLSKYKIPYHAYHYIKAVTLNAARKEAQIFASATSGTNPVFYVIDAECKAIANKKAKAIIEEFEAELRRQVKDDIRVAIYIAHEKYKTWALNYSRYEYVWIPRYGKNTGSVEGSIKPAYKCDLWQYTSNGSVDGIKGRVDIDIINNGKPLSFFLTGIDNKEKNIIMQKGSKGREVKHLQSVLIALGYDLGKYGADGSYGNLTVAAVRGFQNDHGYQQTGSVDDDLYDEMFVALTKK